MKPIFLSCQTEAPDDSKNPPPSFPAPLDVDITIFPTGYETRTPLVSNAFEYRLYVRSDISQQIIPIDYSSYNWYYSGGTHLIINILKTDFSSIPNKGYSPYRFGIRAISIDGLYSDITWSNSFSYP